MKNKKYSHKDVPKMFSNDAVEFPMDKKVLKVDSTQSKDGYMSRELSKNVMYSVKGNKNSDY